MQSMPDHSTIFAFEADFAGALYCVPMCARLKLDWAGVKLSLAVEQRPEWLVGEQLPVQLALHYQLLGRPALSQAQRAGLTPLQRFTLFKLSRPGHGNENFLPALREFGLAPG